MQNILKKISTIAIVILFCLSGISMITAGFSLETPREILPQTETTQISDVIYKCEPDGSITPILVTLQLNTGENRQDALFNACVNRAANDTELLRYLNESGLNLSSIAYIKSRGRGFNLDFTVRIPVKRIMKKYPNLPPFYRNMKIHIIHAQYRRDPRATTVIQPLLNGNSTTLTGSQTVDIAGFIGYTTWTGVVAKRGFILRCGFAGYGLVSVS